MARPSPQTERIGRCLGLLAREPQRSFSLAQIARHLGVSKATCTPMVHALTRAGWLARHPGDRSYRLGQGLVELGRAAEHSGGLDDVVLPVLVSLADAAPSMQSVMWLCSGDHVVLAEIADARGRCFEWSNGLSRGLRLRPEPPLASCLVTWADDAAVDEWLLATRSGDLDEARDRYLPALHASRDRGYVVEQEQALVSQVFNLVHRIADEHPAEIDGLVKLVSRTMASEADRRDVIVAEIDPQATYKPVSINAPVFGRSGMVELVIALTNAPAPMTGAELHRLGGLVRDAAIELTERLGGDSPIGVASQASVASAAAAMSRANAGRRSG